MPEGMPFKLSVCHIYDKKDERYILIEHIHTSFFAVYYLEIQTFDAHILGITTWPCQSTEEYNISFVSTAEYEELKSLFYFGIFKRSAR